MAIKKLRAKRVRAATSTIQEVSQSVYQPPSIEQYLLSLTMTATMLHTNLDELGNKIEPLLLPKYKKPSRFPPSCQGSTLSQKLDVLNNELSFLSSKMQALFKAIQL